MITLEAIENNHPSDIVLKTLLMTGLNQNELEKINLEQIFIDAKNIRDVRFFIALRDRQIPISRDLYMDLLVLRKHREQKAGFDSPDDYLNLVPITHSLEIMLRNAQTSYVECQAHAFQYLLDAGYTSAQVSKFTGLNVGVIQVILESVRNAS